MEKADIVIIGAGVLGLAIAEKLTDKKKNIIVIERHDTFGQEASSRNSEIIHSGIYYPKESLRTRLCVEGRQLLYEFCKDHNIPHKKIGKLIVATNHEEVQELDLLMSRGHENGVDDLVYLNQDEIEAIEPNVEALGAIDSPSTGIVDSHQFMKTLEILAKEKGVTFAYGCEVKEIKKGDEGFTIKVKDVDNEDLSISCNILINCAGIHSDEIAEMAGIDIIEHGYKIHYNKGEYFRVSPEKAKLAKRLIYPTPRKYSLGIHTVIDLQGQMKLGPGAYYVDEVNYDVDESNVCEFYEYVKDFLPFIEKEDLVPDTAGIRAKIQAEGEAAKDFIISDESDKGLPGLINLIGIETPGLTASLSIAKYVEGMI